MDDPSRILDRVGGTRPHPSPISGSNGHGCGSPPSHAITSQSSNFGDTTLVLPYPSSQLLTSFSPSGILRDDSELAGDQAVRERQLGSDMTSVSAGHDGSQTPVPIFQNDWGPEPPKINQLSIYADLFLENIRFP